MSSHIIAQIWPQHCYEKACCTEAAFSLNWWRWQSLSLSLLCTQQLDVVAANSKQFFRRLKIAGHSLFASKNVISSLMCVNMFGGWDCPWFPGLLIQYRSFSSSILHFITVPLRRWLWPKSAAKLRTFYHRLLSNPCYGVNNKGPINPISDYKIWRKSK